MLSELGSDSPFRFRYSTKRAEDLKSYGTVGSSTKERKTRKATERWAVARKKRKTCVTVGNVGCFFLVLEFLRWILTLDLESQCAGISPHVSTDWPSLKAALPVYASFAPQTPPLFFVHATHFCVSNYVPFFFFKYLSGMFLLQHSHFPTCFTIWEAFWHLRDSVHHNSSWPKNRNHIETVDQMPFSTETNPFSYMLLWLV